jgi:hypothetical protein
LFWGIWMLLSGLAFGCTLVIAPALAALTAISLRELWRARRLASSRATLALMLVASLGWVVAGLGGSGADTISAVAHDHGGPAVQDDRALDALLVGTDTRWAAAAVDVATTAGLELSTGKSVMAVDDTNRTRSWPDLRRFQRYVADGQIGYFIRDQRDGPDADGPITRWVAANFTPQRVGDVTVYALAR